jgi:hypothetical protein
VEKKTEVIKKIFEDFRNNSEVLNEHSLDSYQIRKTKIEFVVHVSNDIKMDETFSSDSEKEAQDFAKKLT